MAELHSEFFEMLHLAKVLYDRGLSKKLRDLCGYLALDSDMHYEFIFEAWSMIFEFTCNDYNEDYEMDIWVFADSRIDKFCRLCQEYEHQCALSEEENPYRREIEWIIREAFEFPCYSYDFTWYLSAKERGRRRLVFFEWSEFDEHASMPEKLLDIREGFERLNLRLEKELSDSAKLLQLSTMKWETGRREAA